MDKKHQQNFAMLLVAALVAFVASVLVPANGSDLMDYVQGFLTGIAIVLMVASIIFFSKHYKRLQR